MATFLNILAAIVFFTVISKGYCLCSLDSITVSQAETGKLVGKKQEWNVTISNNCICAHLNLKLSCDGFQTAKEIDPSVLAKSGDECLVYDGRPLHYSSTFNFTYAWDTSFPFKPVYSEIACS